LFSKNNFIVNNSEDLLFESEIEMKRQEIISIIEIEIKNFIEGKSEIQIQAIKFVKTKFNHSFCRVSNFKNFSYALTKFIERQLQNILIEKSALIVHNILI
jgi:hypothetical protein